MHDSPLEELRQVPPALLRGVERVQGTERVLVLRRERQNPLVEGSRLRLVTRDLLGHERYLREQLRLARAIGGGRDDALVELLELVPALVRRQDLLQARERALARGIARKDALQVGARAIVLPESLLVQRRGALGEVELDRRRETGLTRRWNCVGDRGHEVLRALRPLGEHRESIPQVKLGGQLARGAGDDIECNPERPQLLVNSGEADVERAPVLLRSGRRDPDLEDLRLPRELPGLGVRRVENDRGGGPRLGDSEELLDHGDRVVMQLRPRRARRARVRHRPLAHDFERQLCSRERHLGPLQPKSELRDLDVARRALEAFAQVAIPLEGLDGPFEITGGAQETRDGSERVSVLRRDGEDAAVDRDRLVRRLEDVLFERGPLGQDVDLQLLVRPRDAEVEEPAEVVVPIRAAEQAVERMERRLILGVFLHQPAVGLHGVIELPLARLHLRDLRPEIAPLPPPGGVEPRRERLDELPPRSCCLRRCLELRERRVRLPRRGEVVRSARVGERGHAVAELLPGHLRELLEDLELRLIPFRVREEHLVERREPGPLLFLLVERHQRRRRTRVVRARGEDPLVSAEGTLGRLQPADVNVGRAVGELDLEPRVGGFVCRRRQDLGEPFVVVLGLVELRQPVIVPLRHEGVAEDAQRLRMARLKVEHAAPRLLGPFDVLQAVRVDAAQLLQDGELERRVRSRNDAPLEDLGHRLVVLVALGLLLERVERPRRRRIFFEELAVERGGVGSPVQALRGDLRHLEPDLAPREPRRHPLRHPIEQIVERLESAPLRIELAELGDRLRVVGSELRELFVGLERVLDVRELIEPAPGHGAQELNLRPCVRLELREARLRREEIAPAAEGVIDPRELAHGLEVRRVDRDDLGEHGDERGVALDRVLVDRADFAQEREARRGVTLRDSLELAAEEIRERVPAATLPVQALERLARFLVVRVLAEDVPPPLDRLRRVRPFLGELRDLRDDRRALRPFRQRARGVRQDLAEARALAPRRRPLAEEAEHAGVGRLEPAKALEVRLRRFRAPAHLPVHHRDLQDRPCLPLTPERRELPLVERDEVVPHLTLGEEVDERALRFAVRRLDVEHLCVDVLSAIRRVHLPLEHAGETDQARGAIVLRRRRLGPLLEQDGELFPSPLGPQDPLEHVQRARPLGIDRDRLAEAAHYLVDQRGELLLLLPGRELRAPEPVRDLGRADEHRRLERRVSRLLRLVDVFRDDVGPLRPLRVARLDELFCLRVAGA